MRRTQIRQAMAVDEQLGTLTHDVLIRPTTARQTGVARYQMG